MAFDILCLLSDLDSVCLHGPLSEHEEDGSESLSTVYLQILDLAVGDLLYHGFFLSEINSCNIDVSLLITKVQQLIIIIFAVVFISIFLWWSTIPSNACEQALVGILVVEEHLLAFAIYVGAEAVDALVVTDCEHETFCFHEVEDLDDTMVLLMYAFLLVAIKYELTVLPPITSSFEVKHRAFRITGMEKKILRVLHIDAVDPDLHVLTHIDGRKVLNSLVKYERRIQ